MTKYTDPDIIAFRSAWKEALPEPPAGLGPVDVLRSTFDEQHGAIPVAEGCAVDAVGLGGIEGERLTPASGGGNGVLLYLHGGGHVFGSPQSHRHMVSRLADAADMIAYVPEYRLAPENPFPAGLNDAMTAYHALRDLHPETRLVLAGESAGGNLAAALVLSLAAKNLSGPERVYLLSPWLDMTHSGASHHLVGENDLMISTQSLEDCAMHYSGGHDRKDPLVSPIFGNLSAFPPVLLQVSSDEVLLSDSLTFAERAGLAGVAVELQVWPEMVHAWPLFHMAIGKGTKALLDAAKWMIADNQQS